MPATLEELKNVTVKLKANVYFDGGVISHTVLVADGKRKTIGVIRPGQYHFDTGAPELMEIVGGECHVKKQGESNWTTYKAGGSFNVAAKSGFDIKVESGLAEYLCSFD